MSEGGVDGTVAAWRASWSYVVGPALVAGLLIAVIPSGVAADVGWLAGGLVAVVLAIAGLAGSWALRRMSLIVMRDQVIVQNVFSRTRIDRGAVLGVEAARSGVCIWYRDHAGIATVTAAAAQGPMAGYFRRSHIAGVADEVKRELSVEAPDTWVRRNARYE